MSRNASFHQTLPAATAAASPVPAPESSQDSTGTTGTTGSNVRFSGSQQENCKPRRTVLSHESHIGHGWFQKWSFLAGLALPSDKHCQQCGGVQPIFSFMSCPVSSLQAVKTAGVCWNWRAPFGSNVHPWVSLPDNKHQVATTCVGLLLCNGHLGVSPTETDRQATI